MVGELAPIEILVVDDRPENLFVIEEILDRPDYVIVTASSGPEAIRRVKDHDFALVLLDVQMPGMDGFETARQIASESAEPLPILMVTALDRDDSHQVRAYSDGAVDFIYKPIEDEVLRSKVERFAQLKRASRQHREVAVRQTEQSKTLAREKKSVQAILGSVLDTVPVGIVVLDANGRPTLCNAAFRRLTGREEVPPLGSWVVDYEMRRGDDTELALEDLPPWVNLDRKQDRPGLELILKRPTGERTKILMESHAVRNETGAVTEVTVSVTDIGPMQALQVRAEQAERLRSLGLLAGGLAHDFNNLLTVVMGHATFLFDEVPPDSQWKESLRSIIQASETGRLLTTQLMSYAYRRAVSPHPCRLKEAIRSVDQILRLLAPRNVELSFELGDAPDRVLIDPMDLNQIFTNLIRNAVEAIGANPGRITLRTGRILADEALLASAVPGSAAKPGPFCTVEVEDDGPGMDVDTLRRIFDPFYTTKFIGRGLGLSSVLGIVASCEGAIVVRSAPRKGTHFMLLLPEIAEVREPAPVGEPAVATEAAARRKILIVDDADDVRQIAARALKGSGCEIVLARDGAEAIALFQREPDQFDLVLTDFSMPGMDGRDVLEQIRRIRQDLPVVLISGISDAPDLVNSSTSRFDAVLGKPFSVGDLRRVVAAALQRGRQ